jgi:hypothetical protein
MMTLSKVAGLSKEYKNHSPRATCITILGTQYQDTDIATHSGHKSLSAMSLYKRTSDDKKKSMSDTLSSSLVNTVEIINSDSPDQNRNESSSSNCFLIQSSEKECQKNKHNNCCISFGSNETFSPNEASSSNFVNLIPASENEWYQEITTFLEEYDNNASPATQMMGANIPCSTPMPPFPVMGSNMPSQQVMSPFGSGGTNYFSGCTFNFK